MAHSETLAHIAEIKASQPGNIAAQVFDPKWFSTLDAGLQSRLLACMASGIANPDSAMGCYAGSAADYDDLRSFFAKALARHHGVAEDARHVSDWTLPGALELPKPLSLRVRVGRNLRAFPFPTAMTRADRVALEAHMAPVFEALIGNDQFGGAYHSLTPGHGSELSEDDYDALVAERLMFKDMDADRYLVAAGIASDWPHGRGCYISDDRRFVIWVGEEDHLRIMCLEHGTDLARVFHRLRSALDVLDGLDVAISTDLGALTSCPTNLGTAMRASVHIPLPRLTADGTDARVKEIAAPLGLAVRGLGGEHTPIGADGTVDISPAARFCITEAQIVTRLHQGLAQLLAAEDQCSS